MSANAAPSPERLSSSRPQALRLLLECLALALVYAVTALLSLHLASLHPTISSVWPPTGLALAVLLLRGLHLWPGVLLGCFVGSDFEVVSVWTAFQFAVANTLTSVAGAWLVQRYAGGAEPFRRARDSARFVVAACFLAPVLGASLGTQAMVACQAAPREEAAAVWLTWWLGDLTGTLLATPLLLLWSRPGTRGQAVALERILLWGLALISGSLFFLPPLPEGAAWVHALLLPLLWAAFRLSLQEAVSLNVALGALAIAGTARGLGPFAASDLNLALLSVQGFLGTLQISTLMVGGLLQERRQAMAEVTRARDTLEVRVRERTEELQQAVHSLEELLAARDRARRELAETQAQLRQFEKMEAVGRLAGGVAHDFNNSLTPILMHTDQLLLELPPDREEWRKGLVEIREAARRSARLTSQLLAFHRKGPASDSAVRLADVADPMREMIVRLLGVRVQVEVEIPADLPPVRAERTQIEQVLLNLAVNARDAMPEGGRLQVRARRASMPAGVHPREEGAGGADARPPLRTADARPPLQTADARPPLQTADAVCLEVVDTGCGMGPEVLGQVFEPFFTTKQEGTGLGLATVYGIVRKNQGWVDVQSQPGQGSTFRLFFPVATFPAPPVPEPGVPVPFPRARGVETILLVEDEPSIRGIVQRVLERAGYSVAVGADGLEGLEVGTRVAGALDLLVTDVVLPGLGGGELARRLRELKPELGLLFLSGYTPDSAVQPFLDAGTAEFLLKPFSPLDLAVKVRELLDGNRVEA